MRLFEKVQRWPFADASLIESESAHRGARFFE